MAVVDILIIILLATALLIAFQSRRAGAAADERSAADRDVEPLRSEVRELRARIHVLERAITDTHGSADLDAEIERLRDR